MMPDLSVGIGGLLLQNPVMPASGTFGTGLETLIDFHRLGALIPKSVTKRPRKGNRNPRVCEAESGMINSIGIQSKGVDDFAAHELPELAKYHVPIIVSLSGETIDEFAELAAQLTDNAAVSAFELNISCPNLRNNGVAFGMDKEATYRLIKRTRRVTGKPIIAKLTPNVTRIQDIAVAAERAGADALTVANTFLAMAIDTETRKPKLGNVMGGLSGPAVKPLIVRLVFQVHRTTRLPIIASGGIASGQDAVEMMLAGASAVQIGTANFIEPEAMLRVIDEITAYMVSHHVERTDQLIGNINLESGE